MSRSRKEVNIQRATAGSAAMSQDEGTEKERQNLTVQEFSAQLRHHAQEVRDLVKLARRVGALKSGEHLVLKNGEQFGAKELNAAVTAHIKGLRQLKRNYTARGTKKKRAPRQNQGNKGFVEPSFLTPELVAFLRNANFGVVPGTTEPLRNRIEPLLAANIISRGVLTPLLTLYEFENGLRYEGEDGKVYFRVGPEMERYLGPWISELERADRAKTDLQMQDKNSRVKPRFDRNRFVYNRLQSIVNPGIRKKATLNAQELAYLENPQVRQVLEQVQEEVSKTLATRYPESQKNKKGGKRGGQKGGKRASSQK